MLRGQLERGGGGSSATLDGAPPVGLGQCRWRKAGLQEAEQSLHGVQGDHVGSPGGAQDGEQREERAGEGCRGWPRTAPPPCPASPADPRAGPDRPWGRGRGGARNGPFLALFTWPGGATGDEPRDAGAGKGEKCFTGGNVSPQIHVLKPNPQDLRTGPYLESAVTDIKLK